MDMAAEALRIVSTIVRLAGRIVGFAITMFTDTFIAVTVVVAITFVLLSYATDARAGGIIGVLTGAGIDVVSGIDVDVFARADASMWAPTMTASDSIPRLETTEEVLLFSDVSYCCCTTAAWNCRSLQTRMPSCHV